MREEILSLDVLLFKARSDVLAGGSGQTSQELRGEDSGRRWTGRCS